MTDRDWLKRTMRDAMQGLSTEEDARRLRGLDDDELDWLAIQALGKVTMYRRDVRQSDIDRLVVLLRERIDEPTIAEACIRVLSNMWAAGSRIENELVEFARGRVSDPDHLAQCSALTALGAYIRDSKRYSLIEVLVAVVETSDVRTVYEAALDGTAYALGSRGRDLPPIRDRYSDEAASALLQEAVALLQEGGE